jgi:hypothetical protein
MTMAFQGLAARAALPLGVPHTEALKVLEVAHVVAPVVGRVSADVICL